MKRKLRLSKFQPKRTFGVEMEWSSEPLSRGRMKDIINRFPNEEAIVAGYQRNEDRDRWYCKPDSSCGLEVASRVLGSMGSIQKTIEDLKRVSEVHQKLVEAGAKITDECGGHVHIGVGDFSREEFAKALLYWGKFEKFVFEMLPRRRVQGNDYCRSHSNNFRSDTDYSETELKLGFTGRNSFNLAFYNWDAGLEHLKRVEIRCGEATEDSRCLKNWVRFLLHWFQTIKDLPAPGNMNWITLKEGLRLLNLLPKKGEQEILILSPALSELRDWILTRVSCYASFRNASSQRERAKRLQAELYPTQFGVSEEDCTS